MRVKQRLRRTSRRVQRAASSLEKALRTLYIALGDAADANREWARARLQSAKPRRRW